VGVSEEEADLTARWMIACLHVNNVDTSRLTPMQVFEAFSMVPAPMGFYEWCRAIGEVDKVDVGRMNQAALDQLPPEALSK
jgi:hypothetical protein